MKSPISRPLSAAPKPADLGSKLAAGTGTWIDDRLGPSNFVKRSMNKVFPDHWSFLLGEIAMHSFVILLLTGTFLTLFFDPSTREVLYNGSYVPLKGIPMSAAYESTVRLSFDVRAGLLFRQLHHWAALLFVASICVHLMRVFFTGAFRKPRELNWIIGIGLLTMAFLEGFAGYSLPDDLLSGTGLRIAHSIMLSIPVVGTWATYLVFGGDYPGDAIIGRLYIVHVFLVPGAILGLISAHLGMVWYQKHTQFRGPGRTEDNVVGERFFPHYAIKVPAFALLVFGMLALLSGLAQINPIWLYGPYDPSKVSAGSQPDWYIGFLEGALRIMPNWELRALNHTLSFQVLFPSVILPGIIFTGMALYPFIEARMTGDHSVHNLLDRPRDNPRRTALGVMSLSWYVVLWISGGNDVIASLFHLSVNTITEVARVAVFVVPPIAYWATKRICWSLQARDHDREHHGVETGVITRRASGEFVEIHAPVPARVKAPVRYVDGGPDEHGHGEPAATEPAAATPGHGDAHGEAAHKPNLVVAAGRATRGFLFDREGK